jgi:hypothetical protein
MFCCPSDPQPALQQLTSQCSSQGASGNRFLLQLSYEIFELESRARSAFLSTFSSEITRIGNLELVFGKKTDCDRYFYFVE